MPRPRLTVAPAGSRLALPPPADGGWVHLVETGLVRPVAITTDGREFGLGLLGPGEAFLQDEREAAPGIGLYVEAVDDARCLTFPRGDLPAVAAEDPETAARLLHALCGRAADLAELAVSLTLESPADRLARLIGHLARRHGVAEGGAVRVRVRQQDLAAMVGLCRETVNAALRRLAAQGRLRVGRQTIWLPAAGDATDAG